MSSDGNEHDPVKSKEAKCDECDECDDNEDLMAYRIDDIFYSHHSLLPDLFGRAYLIYLFRVVGYLYNVVYMDWTIIIRHPINFLLVLVYFAFSIFALFTAGLWLAAKSLKRRDKVTTITDWAKVLEETKPKVLEAVLKQVKKGIEKTEKKNLDRDLETGNLETNLKELEETKKVIEKDLKDLKKDILIEENIKEDLKKGMKLLGKNENPLKPLDDDPTLIIKENFERKLDKLETRLESLEKHDEENYKGNYKVFLEEELKNLEKRVEIYENFELENSVEIVHGKDHEKGSDRHHINQIPRSESVDLNPKVIKRLEERVDKLEKQENLENLENFESHKEEEHFEENFEVLEQRLEKLGKRIENLEKNNNLYKLFSLKSLLFFATLVYKRKEAADAVTSQIHNCIKDLKCNLNDDENDEKCYMRVYENLCKLPVAPGAPKAPEKTDKPVYKDIEDIISYLLSNNEDEQDIKGTIKDLDIKFTSISELNSDNGGSYCGMFWSEKENFIVVSFKGTSPTNFTEWLNDLTFQCVDARNYLFGRVHRGFYHYLFPADNEKADKDHPCQNIIEAVACKAKALKKINNDKRVNLWITGHSLGGALATLFYARLLTINVAEHENWKLRGAATFASPAVGDNHFAAELAFLENDPRNETCPLWRIVVKDDLVPKMPHRACEKHMRKYGYHYNVLMNYSQVGDKVVFHNGCNGTKVPTSLKQFFRSKYSTRCAREFYFKNYGVTSNPKKIMWRLLNYIPSPHILRMINSHSAVGGYFKALAEYEEIIKIERRSGERVILQAKIQDEEE